MMKLDDPRVFYDHRPERRSVGMKRNVLISRARGEIIAQFDDDDFYGKGYLSGMISAMRNGDADFVKLFGFFMYSQLHICSRSGICDKTRAHITRSETRRCV
jgi:glycosyltransferase involved in cell wall biosynthesis